MLSSRQPRLWLTLAIVSYFGPFVLAQNTDDNWLQVTATVTGIFDFQIDGADHPEASPATHDFGTISHTGINGGVKNAGKVYYTADGAMLWSVHSAPRRTVNIFLRSPSKVLEPPLGGMQLDQLSIEMTVATQAGAGSGTSLGMIPVAADELLVENVLAGNGSARAAGAINLEIHVDGNDKDGDNVWLFQLEATGI